LGQTQGWRLRKYKENPLAEAVKVFLLTLSALFPIVDPLAGSPIFLALTEKYSREIRTALSWRVALNSLLLGRTS
jgi:small neutral amino acid transporter SnatA (MarC family)